MGEGHHTILLFFVIFHFFMLVLVVVLFLIIYIYVFMINWFWLNSVDRRMDGWLLVFVKFKDRSELININLSCVFLCFSPS